MHKPTLAALCKMDSRENNCGKEYLFSTAGISSIITGTFPFESHRFSGRYYCKALTRSTNYCPIKYNINDALGTTLYCLRVLDASKNSGL
jgi:hypothetical protein